MLSNGFNSIVYNRIDVLQTPIRDTLLNLRMVILYETSH
nr:MAG TPA: hypothetical protein [Caudoviricetes sp.]DAT64665.1 MAG TPA: hypothetical protein [Caudoviricetes sp.]